MCGIAGFQFGPRFNPDLAFRSILALHLASAMDRRGGDSYGVAKLNSRGEVKVWKGLGHAVGNLRLPDVANTNQFILHTRKRTHGAISIENAHPLTCGHILGTHNGMVNNHDSLNQKYKRSFDLDSRHIFAHLNEGLDVREIGVYGAISWIDLNEPRMINLCRLTVGGDLEVYGIGKDVDHVLGIVYASTKDPIEQAFLSLRTPCFRYATLSSKRRYWMKGGRLFIDDSEKGAMPFGEDTYYHKSTQIFSSYGGYKGRLWEMPSKLKICKPCRKQYKKNNNFRPIQLCASCYDIWVDFCGSSVVDEKKSLGPEESDSPQLPAGLLKPGGPHGSTGQDEGSDDVTEKLERVEELELMEAFSGKRPLIVPPYLEQWDLCAWCADEAVKNKGFNVARFCSGCKHNWDEMLIGLREMEKEERKCFSPVLTCSHCRYVPTFGWLNYDITDSEGKRKPVICKACKSREVGEERRGWSACVVCGHKDTTIKFKPVVKENGGQVFYPYCRQCFNKKGEVVPITEKREGANA